ncbi:uncharacterized protein LOC143255177 isoform X2 [Tachypleus tridentatus]|uniref:uncharacterized protein LOC143255177 isoform X2 n=1 Tax=Tachypleus tridentatus TaxID=6853 RepID=UPI003FD4ED77
MLYIWMRAHFFTVGTTVLLFVGLIQVGCDNLEGEFMSTPVSTDLTFDETDATSKPPCPPGQVFCFQTNLCAEACGSTTVNENLTWSCPAGYTYCVQTGNCSIECPLETFTLIPQCPPIMTYCVETNLCTFSNCGEEDIDSIMCPPGTSFCATSEKCTAECSDEVGDTALCLPGLIYCAEADECVFCIDEGYSSKAICPSDHVFCPEENRCVPDCTEEDESPLICSPESTFCLENDSCVPDCYEDKRQTICPPHMVFCATESRCVPECNKDEPITICPPHTVFCTAESRCVPDCNKDKRNETLTICPLHMIFCTTESNCVSDCNNNETDETRTICPPHSVFCATESRCVPDCNKDKRNETLTICPPHMIFCTTESNCVSDCNNNETDETRTICPPHSVFCATESRCVPDCNKDKANETRTICPLHMAFCATESRCVFNCNIAETNEIRTICSPPLVFCATEARCVLNCDKDEIFETQTICPSYMAFCGTENRCVPDCIKADTVETQIICPPHMIFCPTESRCVLDCNKDNTRPICPPHMVFCPTESRCVLNCNKDETQSICPLHMVFCPTEARCVLDCNKDETRSICPPHMVFCPTESRCVLDCNKDETRYICPPHMVFCPTESRCVLDCNKDETRSICPPHMVFCPTESRCVLNCNKDETQSICPLHMVFCPTEARCVLDCNKDETRSICPPHMVFCPTESRCVFDCNKDETRSICPPHMVFCPTESRCVLDCNKDETRSICPPHMVFCPTEARCVLDCNKDETRSICPLHMVFCPTESRCVLDCNKDETRSICPPHMVFCPTESRCVLDCNKDETRSICPPHMVFCPTESRCVLNCNKDETQSICPLHMVFCPSEARCVLDCNKDETRSICPLHMVFCPSEARCVLDCNKDETRSICPSHMVFCPSEARCVLDCNKDETRSICPSHMVFCPTESRCVLDCNKDETRSICPSHMVFCPTESRCVLNCNKDETRSICPPHMVFCPTESRCVPDCNKDKTRPICPPHMVFCATESRCVPDCDKDKTRPICPPHMVFCATEARCVPDCKKDEINETKTICPAHLIFCPSESRCVLDCNKDEKRPVCPPHMVFCATEARCVPDCNKDDKHLICPPYMILCATEDRCISRCKMNNTLFSTTQNTTSLVPQSAWFTDSLIFIVIRFNKDLQPQQTFSCTRLFTYEISHKLGRDAICDVNRNKVIITLGINATITPNQTLRLEKGNQLYDGSVSPKKANGSDEARGEVTIQKAVNHDFPHFELFGPREVCGGVINISTLMVTGDGSSELTYFWSVFPMSNSSLFGSHHAISKDLESRNKNISSRVYSIDMNKLTAGIDYIILASGENRFHHKTKVPATLRIRRIKSSPLAVTIHGRKVVSAQKDNTFEANVEICNSIDLLESKIEYSWSINSSEIRLAGFTGKSVTLSKGVLRGGYVYNITVTVVVNGSDGFVKREVYHTFRVAMEPLQGRINSCNLSVGNMQRFSLDGSYSFDPSNTPDDMQYEWSCFQQNYTIECPLAGNLTSKPVLLVEPGSLLPDTYIFNLKVTKDDRESTTSTIVKVVSGRLPTVVIETGSNIRVSSTSDIQIIGRVTSDVDVVIQWSNVEGQDLDTVNLTGVSPFTSSRMYAAPVVDALVPLVVPAGQPSWMSKTSQISLKGNAIYKFRLKAEPLNYPSAYSEVVIRTNAPPVLCHLKKRTEKRAGLTWRYMTATEGWKDDASDYPLKYTFYTGNNYRLRTITLAPAVVKYVYQPKYGTQEIYGVKVCDSFDSCSSKMGVSFFLKREPSGENETAEVEDLITTKLNDGDYDIAFATALMNRHILRKPSLRIQDIIDKFSKHLLNSLSTDSRNDAYVDEAASFLRSVVRELNAKLLNIELRNNTIITLVKLKNSILERYRFKEEKVSTTNETRTKTTKIGTRRVKKTLPNDLEKIMWGIDKLMVARFSEEESMKWLLGNQTLYLAGRCHYNFNQKFHLKKANNGIVFLEKKSLDFSVILYASSMTAFNKWLCDNDQSCYGSCVGHTKVNYNTGALLKEDIQGRLNIIELFDPKTGELVKTGEFKIIVLFSLYAFKFRIPEGKRLTCGRLDLTSMNWTAEGCSTTSNVTEKASVVACSCNFTGIFGAILEDIPSTTQAPTVTQSFVVYDTMNDTEKFENMKSYQNTEEEKIVRVTIKLNTDYNKTVSGRKQQFIDHIRKQLADLLRIQLSTIQGLTVRRGSVVVDFNMTSSNKSEEKAEELKKMSENGTLALTTLDGEEMPVDSVSMEKIEGEETPDENILISTTHTYFTNDISSTTDLDITEETSGETLTTDFTNKMNEFTGTTTEDLPASTDSTEETSGETLTTDFTNKMNEFTGTTTEDLPASTDSTEETSGETLTTDFTNKMNEFTGTTTEDLPASTDNTEDTSLSEMSYSTQLPTTFSEINTSSQLPTSSSQISSSSQSPTSSSHISSSSQSPTSSSQISSSSQSPTSSSQISSSSQSPTSSSQISSSSQSPTSSSQISSSSQSPTSSSQISSSSQSPTSSSQISSSSQSSTSSSSRSSTSSSQSSTQKQSTESSSVASSSSITQKATTNSISTVKISVSFKFFDEYDLVVKGREQQFKTHIVSQLSSKIRLPTKCFQDVIVLKGSIVFSFNLVPVHDESFNIDLTSLQEAKTELERKVQNGELTFTGVDGKRLLAVPLISTTSSPNVLSAFTPLVLGIVVCTFVLILVLVVLAAIVVKHITKYNCKVTPAQNESRPPSYRSNENIGSLSEKDNISKSCYDSRILLGPQSYLRRESVPSAPVYQPPTNILLNKTQRPPTALRNKLKDEWNVDTDNCSIRESPSE